jgi:hypothetical protein
MEFLSNLEPLLRYLWYAAIASSLFFIVQTILTFIGLDSGDGIEADFSGDLDGADAPFQLFSLRNLVNFFLGFSWAGIVFYPIITNKFVLLTVALIVGLSFVAMFFFIIKQFMRLSEDNSFKYSQTVSKTASVYIPIPGHNKGQGKIQLSVNGSVHEINAVTSGERLETGTIVRVLAVESDGLVKVEILS